jgi:hypothetical protein
VLFFFQATPEEGASVFDQYWPEARAVSDPDRVFYAGFGLARGSLGQMLRPSLWLRGLAASRKGYAQGRTQGDPRQMPGLFVVRQGEIVHRHRFRHAGDHPDFAALGGRGAVPPGK